MPAAFRQTSFAGGELAPELYGRSDLAKYPVGLRSMRNFFASRQGAAVSRPGTVRAADTKGDAQVRLIPFIYSDGTAYVLEFGASYIRFHSDGAPVLLGGVPYEVVTPYALADLQYLKYAQVGAVLTLACKGYPPAELTFTSATSWAYAAISFDRVASTSGPVVLRFAVTPAAPDTVPIDFSATNGDTPRAWGYKVTEVRRDSKGNVFETAPASVTSMRLDWGLPWNANITYAHNTQVISGGTTYASLAANNLNHAVTDATWWATALETQGVELDPLAPFVVDPDRPVVVRLVSPYGLITTDPNFLTYKIYRGQGQFYGWIGDSLGDFTDVGSEPDYTQQPPQGLNPFSVFDSSGALVRTEQPNCVSFYEGRRTFGATAQRPATIFESVVDDYANFDSPAIPTASSAINFTLASRKFEEIRSLVPVGPALAAFTQSSFWLTAGSSGPIQADDIDAKRQGEVGASWVDPLVLGEGVLFVRSKGTGVRVANTDLLRQGLSSSDISIFASHLFIGHTVVDWCHAEDPWGLVLAVREDGLLLCLTYVREHDLFAWSWWDTQGVVESVCSIPEGLEDAVYLVVRRTVNGVTKRFVERLSSRLVTTDNANQYVGVDCAGIYSGAPTSTVTGLSWLEGQTVYGLADGNVVGPLTVTGGAVTLLVAASYVVLGLQYFPELEQLDLASQASELKMKTKQVTRVGIEVSNSRGLLGGPDFDHLTELKQRQVSDSYGAIGIASQLFRLAIQGRWGVDGRACLRQRDPLPLTVCSITREVDIGEG